MTAQHISLILLPTLQCNADCEYCFEHKTNDSLSLEAFTILLSKVMDYLDDISAESITIYWQGGEVLTLPPQWFEQAQQIINQAEAARSKKINNSIQSNLIGYHQGWDRILKGMFNGQIGSSLDYPNLYRKVVGHSPEDFNEIWKQKYLAARESGLNVSIISLPNVGTLRLDPEEYYSYYFDEIGLAGFQINTPFPGGPPNPAKKNLVLEPRALADFLIALVDIWVERGYPRGQTIGPFDTMLDFFLKGDRGLPCLWHSNCSDQFFCIDPRGNVSQCDCWVASYPEFRFGNIFDPNSLSQIMTSPARRKIRRRPIEVIQKEDCVDCQYLTICHGGCPIRTFTATGDLYTKDPYCQTYQAIFAHMEKTAVRLAKEGKVVSSGPPSAPPA